MEDKAPPATGSEQQYGQWAAPKVDGALLIWPDARDLPRLIRENAAHLESADVRVYGRPLPELRRSARSFIGHTVGPLVATGHQTELHHPGVWIKNAVIAAAAEACGGAALHVAVDTDAPKHLKLKWPGFSAPFTDDPHINGAAWSGLLDPPTPAHLDHLISAAADAERDGRASEQARIFLERCRAFLVDQRDAIAPLDLPSMLANAQHALDWDLGLRYSSLTLSGLLMSEPWSAFVCGVASDASGFAAAYNRALAEHRREAGIDSPDRPMPDLVISGQRTELPFWLDDIRAGRRWRAEVEAGGDGSFELVAAGVVDRFGFTSHATAPDAPEQLMAWMRRHGLRLSPRALSLTMFLRLAVCDLFVHGIGGGHYDQVTDRLIRDYFGLEPPTFAVSTATLYHPLSLGRERVCMPCLKHEGHELAHRALGQGKLRWLAEIEAAGDFHARRAVFDRMHDARRAAMQSETAYLDWQHRMSEAAVRLEEEAELFDRELFYGIQPRDRLLAMIDRVKDAIGG